MFSYVVKRIIYAILTLFLVITITFFLMKLIPGGPFLAEKAPSEATLEALNEKYGLNEPYYIQYKNYLVKLLQGDLGPSMKQRGRTVSGIIKEQFPVSAKIGIIAVIISVFIGIPLGAVAALKRGKWIDNVIIFFATLGTSVPSFVVATVLMIVLSLKLELLPTIGLATPKHYVMPVMVLALYPISYISRLTRSSMLDALGQEYMKTAKSKGVSGFKTLFKHALRNAILPVVTYLGPLLAYILSGSFVVEKIFTIPGLGNAYVSSITNRDYPLIMGTTIFLAALVIVMNVLVDIIYKLVDPRIKLK